MPLTIIRHGRVEDLANAADILEQHSITRPFCSRETLEREGFFVKLKKADELTSYIEQSPDKKILIGEVETTERFGLKNRKIAAVLLARNSKYWFEDTCRAGFCTGLSLDKKGLEVVSSPAIEYEYIARNRIPFNTRKLTDHFLIESLVNGYQFAFGKIYTAPIANRISMQYHKKLGFTKMGEQTFQFKDVRGFENQTFKADLMYLDLKKYAQGARGQK